LCDPSVFFIAIITFSRLGKKALYTRRKKISEKVKKRLTDGDPCAIIPTYLLIKYVISLKGAFRYAVHSGKAHPRQLPPGANARRQGRKQQVLSLYRRVHGRLTISAAKTACIQLSKEIEKNEQL
jgi:hypothetical protein